jgi:hypothetical protein
MFVELVELDREDWLPDPVIEFFAFPAVDDKAVVAEVAPVDGAKPHSEPDVPDIVDALDVPVIADV